jgi:osmotically-inducible protein OsmY
MKFAVATTSLALAALLAASALLSACAPLLVGGAVAGSAMVVTDRRTSGTQLEDESIELKSLTRIRETVGDTAHVSATSYDRIVLLTGEVPSEAAKTAVAQAISRIENVRSVVNELAVMEATSLTERSGDALLTTRVKTAFIDAKDVFANAIKVVSERGNVYLMGKVTEREANRATDLARSVGGVKKVVRVFEIISEAELADIQPKQAPASK